ncbi:MAG TPA: hypothetical protein VKZ65_00285 [Glycomyces sp.]|nr:hypothetical protein [Glycomyces sp.]
MTDAQHVPTPDAAAVPEPAAADDTPQVEQQAPASDGTPEIQAETPQAPVTEHAETPDETAARLAELEAQRAQWEQQQAEYQQWQQQQAQAAAMRQREAAAQQYREQLNTIAKQIAAADTDEDIQKHLDSFVRQIAGTIAQTAEQRVAQTQQQYQQEIASLREQMRQQLDEALIPAFADKVLAEYGLEARYRDVLLKAKHPDDMPAIAQVIQSTIQSTAPQVQQQVAATMAGQRRAANPDALVPGGGTPPPKKPEPMKATDPRMLDALAGFLGYNK